MTFGAIFYFSSEKALIERTSAQLASINILKNTQIEEYFKFKEQNLKIFLVDIVKEQHLKEKARENTILNHAITTNIVRLATELDYLNVAYLDENFSRINISDSSDTNFIEVLKHHKVGDKKLQAIWDGKSTDIKIFDMIPFEDDTELKVLIICPIKNQENVTVGLLVLEQLGSKIQEILHEVTGMGETGESYIVARDYKMRSKSRFIPNQNPSFIKVRTKAVDKAFQGIEDVEVIDDFRNEKVLSAYRKVNITGLHWALISEIDYSEAMKPVHKLGKYIFLVGTLISLGVFLITIIIAGYISRPIVALQNLILNLSKGELPDQNPVPKNLDEIGDMTLALGYLIDGLKRNAKFALEIGNGNLALQYEPLSDSDDIGQSLLQMRDRLKNLKEKESDMMRERSSALLEGQEKERRRLARDLHDGIGQMLTAIKFKTSAIIDKTLATQIQELISETIQEIRRISINVMPSELLDFGLHSALKTLCNNITSYSGLVIKYNYQPSEDDLTINFETSASLYRIIQEALNNIVKHAEAKKVIVTIKHTHQYIKIDIQDNGRGFNIGSYNEKTNQSSSGLKNMRERTSLLRGTFKIESNKEQGTTINISVPLGDQEHVF
jgi:two-component system NarL family sensor kinase